MNSGDLKLKIFLSQLIIQHAFCKTAPRVPFPAPRKLESFGLQFRLL